MAVKRYNSSTSTWEVYAGYGSASSTSGSAFGNISASGTASVNNLIVYGSTASFTNTITASAFAGDGSRLTNLNPPTSTTITTNVANTIASLSATTYRSAEFTVQLTQGTKYRLSKVLALSDGSSVNSVEHSILEMGGLMSGVNVTASYSAGNILLLSTVTDASTTSVTSKVISTGIVV